MDHSSLPVACSLGPQELSARRDQLLPGLLARAVTRESIPGGYRWRFDFDAGLLSNMASVIEAEHQCCPFLRFGLLVEPANGPVSLEVTGPAGTTDFLSTLLDSRSDAEG